MALLILGMFLETVSILVITLPILYPIVVKPRFELIWFAIIMVINMELTLISPPVGLNLFILKGLKIDNVISEIVRSVVPYAVIMIIFIVILAIFPEIPTFLVDDVDKKTAIQ